MELPRSVTPFKDVVEVAALPEHDVDDPEILIDHVPLAPDPEFDGTPRFVRADAASLAPVPPFATAKSAPDQLSLLIDERTASEPSPRFDLAEA